MPSPTRSMVPPRWKSLGALATLMLLLHLAGLQRQSLWLDELGAWAFTTTASWRDLFVLLFDPQSGYPLYHVLLRFWITLFGDEAWVLRALSLLCGLAAALLTARLGERFARPAPVTLLLLLLSPFLFHYTQEVTAYSMLMLWSAAWLWAFVRVPVAVLPTGNSAHQHASIDHGRNRLRAALRPWSTLAILAVAGLLIHRVAAFSVAAGLLSLMLLHAIRHRRWVLAGTALFLAWLVMMLATSIYREYALVLNPAERVAPLTALWLTLWHFALDQGPSGLGLVLLAPFGILLWLGGRDLLQRARNADLGAALLLMANVLSLALFLAQLLMIGRYEARYLAALYPAWALIITPTTTLAHRTIGRSLISAALGAQLLAAVLPGGAWGALPVREQYREALTSLLHTIHPDDRLLIYPPYIDSAWRYYAPRIDPDSPHLPVVAADDLPPAWPGQREFVVIATAHAEFAARHDPNAPSLADPLGTVPCGTRHFHGIEIRCRIVASQPDLPARPVVALFGERMVLRNMTLVLPPAGLRPGDTLPIRFDWEALSALPDVERITLSLSRVGAPMPVLVAMEPFGSPGEYGWSAGQRFTDRRALALFDPQGHPLPPGTYRLSLSVESATGPLRVYSPGRQPAPTLTIATVTVGSAGPPTCVGNGPDGCGQVRLYGNQLFDHRGIWRAQGVQFFLPAHGINERSFWDARYRAAVADGSLDRWLDLAALRLHPNLLRIFVELPRWENNQLITPTDPATVYDFAERAAQRGMRLGIVLHNSADWNMTPERQAWIEELISMFLAEGTLERVAYLNSDNEINNHCLPARQFDCFARDPAYREGAIAWAHSLYAIVKARSPQLLVTVGMSTELDSEQQPGGVANYFRPDNGGRTLAAAADLLAPHNYAGGAAAVLADIRQANYRGPVLLEEYGFPTDPAPQNSIWTEGPATCRRDPMRPECAETAPYFVELNLRALRSGDYAGGVAWMLADTLEKDRPDACTSAGLPFDLWTGLLAAGTSYCPGGTTTRSEGAPKATAIRVCAYHTGSTELCLADAIHLRVR